MGRDGRLVLTGLSAALATAIVVSPLPAAASTTSASTRAASTQKLARIGHAAFWQCPATTTDLLVVVNTLTLQPGATLNVSYTVRNGASSSCSYTAPYAGAAPGPTAAVLTAGPCGSIAFRIEDRHHRSVWPGTEVANCPALGFAQLAPGATVSGTGSWDQLMPNSTHRVRPGRYTLVVDNAHFSFPLRVVGTTSKSKS
jgi:hypothetical protein